MERSRPFASELILLVPEGVPEFTGESTTDFAELTAGFVGEEGVITVSAAFSVGVEGLDGLRLVNGFVEDGDRHVGGCSEAGVGRV